MNDKITAIEREFGKIEITHPTTKELEQLIALYKSEDLDLRRLVPLSQEAYSSMGKEALEGKWQTALEELNAWVKSGKISAQTLQAIRSQYLRMIDHINVPAAGTVINDPFNMSPVEREMGLEKLQEDQLSNIVVIKVGSEVVSSARVLCVEGSWEVVSIVTKEKFRGRGFASLAIQQVLT